MASGGRYTTTEERRRMCALALRGFTLSEIARATHRSTDAARAAVYGSSRMILALDWSRESDRQAALASLGERRTKYRYRKRGL